MNRIKDRIYWALGSTGFVLMAAPILITFFSVKPVVIFLIGCTIVINIIGNAIVDDVIEESNRSNKPSEQITLKDVII